MQELCSMVRWAVRAEAPYFIAVGKWRRDSRTMNLIAMLKEVLP